MQPISTLLHDALMHDQPYRATAVEERVYRRLDRQMRKGGRRAQRFHDDLMQLLTQYQEQGFARGLQCGLRLAAEPFCRETL